MKNCSMCLYSEHSHAPQLVSVEEEVHSAMIRQALPQRRQQKKAFITRLFKTLDDLFEDGVFIPLSSFPERHRRSAIQKHAGLIVEDTGETGINVRKRTIGGRKTGYIIAGIVIALTFASCGDAGLTGAGPEPQPQPQTYNPRFRINGNQVVPIVNTNEGPVAEVIFEKAMQGNVDALPVVAEELDEVHSVLVKVAPAATVDEHGKKISVADKAKFEAKFDAATGHRPTYFQYAPDLEVVETYPVQDPGQETNKFGANAITVSGTTLTINNYTELTKGKNFLSQTLLLGNSTKTAINGKSITVNVNSTSLTTVSAADIAKLHHDLIAAGAASVNINTGTLTPRFDGDEWVYGYLENSGVKIDNLFKEFGVGQIMPGLTIVNKNGKPALEYTRQIELKSVKGADETYGLCVIKGVGGSITEWSKTNAEIFGVADDNYWTYLKEAGLDFVGPWHKVNYGNMDTHWLEKRMDSCMAGVSRGRDG